MSNELPSSGYATVAAAEPIGTTGAQYVIPTLGISEGSYVFSYLGAFLSFITPHDLPVLNCVLELLREAFQARLSLGQLIMEALKIESGFICLIALFLLVSMIPLLMVTFWGCSMHTYPLLPNDSMVQCPENGRAADGLAVDSLLTLEESMNSRIQCRRRIFQVSLQVIVVLLVLCVSAMLVTNEQISTAINKTPDLIRASLKDMERFVRHVQKTISFGVLEAVNTTVDRVKTDLDEIDKLLGEPIQKEIEMHTGIDVSFNTVNGICSINNDIIHRIQLMHDSIVKAILICQEATTRTEEFQVQLNVLQRQCSGRDRPLCDTLRLKSFSENNFVNTLVKLQTDPALYKMLTLGEQDMNGVTRNLSVELASAQNSFRGLVEHIRLNSSRQRNDILRQLAPMTESMQNSTQVLAAVAASLIETIDQTWSFFMPLLDNFEEVGQTIWSLALSVAVVTLLITLLLMGSLSYGCCQAENRAGNTFIVGAAAMSIGSIALSLFSVFGMLLGGHGEVFVCRSLYDHPDYVVLGKLFDRPTHLYVNGTSVNGLIGDLLTQNGSLPNNATITNALRRCEQDGASYSVFQLESLMNVSRIVDIREYAELVHHIDAFTVSAEPLCSLTDPLQSIFEDMYVIDINLSGYRNEINLPAPERDISMFIEQMQRVALHIQDVGTSSRMATLGNRARRLQTSVLQPLEAVRSEIIYHLTALELQKEPWSNQINQSLLHLKTTQFFLNKDAESIFLCQTKAFKDRLKGHLTANREHLLWLLNDHLATCRPLFQIFDANRSLFCRHTMDPLNGLWFSALVCMLLWLMATPISLGLASIYRRITCTRELSKTNSHQTPSDSLIISEQSHWVTSSSQQTTSADIDRSNWGVCRQDSVRSIRLDVTDLSNTDDY